MHSIQSLPHKADESVTIHLRELDADQDRDLRWQVAATKEGFPPHATWTFYNLPDALSLFQHLTGAVYVNSDSTWMTVRELETLYRDSGV